MAANGFLYEFGSEAIALGNVNASTAINDMLESNFSPKIIPGGSFRCDDPIIAPVSGEVWCDGMKGLSVGYITAAGDVDPYSTYQGSRLIANFNGEHIVTFEKEQIWWFGGIVDTQQLSGHSKAGFYCPARWAAVANPSREHGWGFGIIGATIMGNRAELIAASEANVIAGTAGGTDGVVYGFTDQTVENGHLIGSFVDITVLGCNRGWYHEPFHETVYQWGGQHDIRVVARDTRQAIVNHDSSTNLYKGAHYAGNIFPSQAAANAVPSVYDASKDTGRWQTEILFDDNFGAGELDGKYFNEKTFQFAGGPGRTKRASKDDLDRAISLGSAGEARYYFNRLRFEGTGRFIPPTATQTQLRDSTHAINQGRALGMPVFDTTNGIMVLSNGANSNSTWLANGSTFHTPTP
jgi:hypothetical protein